MTHLIPFADRCRTARERLNWTIADAAARAGTDEITLARWERDGVNRVKLANIYGPAILRASSPRKTS